MSRGQVAIYALSAPAAATARHLAEAWTQAQVFMPDRLALPTKGEQGFERFATALAGNFNQYDGHVIFAAAGIVVRALAGLMQGKDADPAVVVLDPAGRFAVSLLSGHLGGANDLAQRVAGLLGGQAVITTATDNVGVPSMEVVAAEQGLKVENMQALARISRDLVEGKPVALHDPEDWLKTALAGYEERFVARAEPSLGEPTVWVGWRALQTPPAWLVLRPACLAVGMGCNRGTSATEMRDLLEQVFAENKLALGSLLGLATVEAKRDEQGLAQLAWSLQTTIEYYSAVRLNSLEVPNPSKAAQKHIGTKSVCEAAALTSASADQLLVTKQKSQNATLAVARLKKPAASA